MFEFRITFTVGPLVGVFFVFGTSASQDLATLSSLPAHMRVCACVCVCPLFLRIRNGHSSPAFKRRTFFLPSATTIHCCFAPIHSERPIFPFPFLPSLPPRVHSPKGTEEEQWAEEGSEGTKTGTWFEKKKRKKNREEGGEKSAADPPCFEI